jgi:hypothetical protein
MEYGIQLGLSVGMIDNILLKVNCLRVEENSSVFFLILE